MDAKDADCLIRAEGLGKAFPGVIALDDVSFDLRGGEVHALMGENGAGKSTLMKILAGVYRKDSGRLWVQGEEVDFHTPAQAQAKGVGIVHQELHLAQHLTVAQNMYIGREAHRWGWLDEDRLNRDASVLFEHLNVKLDPAAQVSGLTVAAQQMVEIAKALTFRSRVLIMDEPTAALNTREVEELFRVIHQLRDEGVGIVYISHKMDEIQRIADRLTVMRDGKTIATVPADTPMPQVVSMMVGREIKAHVKEVPDTSGNPVLLEVKGLSRGRAVQNASLTVRRGEIVGLAGLMGAGRTELARLVFGADRREAGEIWVDGQKIDIRSPKDAVQAGIGYLSEDRKMLGLATGMNVEANVTLASLHRFKRGAGWLHHKAMREHAHELVQKLRVKTPGLDQTVRLLSGGNQQKVVMAKWLLRDCQVLFIDEPTRGIDVGAKAEIHHLLNELAAQGRAIVVISSELPEVLLLSHRVVVMCEGRITGELPGDTATQEQIMALATQRTVLA